MKDLEIFDKDGNVLHIADVIYSYMKQLSDKHDKNIEDVYLGYDPSKWNKYKAPSIFAVTVEDNGYDAKDVYAFGDEDVIKVNCI